MSVPSLTTFRKNTSLVFREILAYALRLPRTRFSPDDSGVCYPGIDYKEIKNIIGPDEVLALDKYINEEDRPL